MKKISPPHSLYTMSPCFSIFQLQMSVVQCLVLRTDELRNQFADLAFYSSIAWIGHPALCVIHS